MGVRTRERRSSGRIDWDALCALGLPLLSVRRSRVERSPAALVTHLRRALREIQTLTGDGGAERKVVAVRALLLALRGHFPTFYRTHLGRSRTARALIGRDPDGRVLESSRIARAYLAEYL